MTHVPYKGTAPALQDLIGGQIQVMMDVPSSILNDEVYKWGKVIKQAGVKIEG